MKKDEKNIDIDLLLFYLGISIICFVLYIIRHPLFSDIFIMENSSEVIISYLPDLIVFLSVFIPYIMVIMVLLIVKLAEKKEISDNYFVILFFPLLSFFMKGMSLLQVYTNLNMIQLIKDNFAFFSFLFAGPFIVALNKIIIFMNFKVGILPNKKKTQ